MLCCVASVFSLFCVLLQLPLCVSLCWSEMFVVAKLSGIGDTARAARHVTADSTWNAAQGWNATQSTWPRDAATWLLPRLWWRWRKWDEKKRRRRIRRRLNGSALWVVVERVGERGRRWRAGCSERVKMSDFIGRWRTTSVRRQAVASHANCGLCFQKAGWRRG